MFRSLRFRLPAFFLAGILLSGLIVVLVSLQLFRSYAHTQALRELRREAVGVAGLYKDQADQYIQDAPVNKFAARKLEEATGDHIYYVGTTTLFPGETDGLIHMPANRLDMRRIHRGETYSFTFVPPGLHSRYLAVATPANLAPGLAIGAFVLVRPESSLRTGWVQLLQRLTLALIGGLLVAGAFGWYLPRRITQPVLALSDAAVAIARGGYDVEIPPVPSGDAIAHLADRFREMAVRLSEAE